MKKSDPIASGERAAKLVVAAESHLERRDWSAADNLFREAVTLDATPASRIAYGVCLSRQERFFEAISVFTPVLDGVDRSAIGIVCHNLAAIYRDVGDLDLARRFQWRATLLQDDAGPEDLLGMANEALTGDRHQVAEALVMTAIEMNGDASDENSDGELVATLGLIKAALDSPEEGLMTLFAAYRRHQAVRDFRSMGADLMNMAVLFGEVHRYRAERACLNRAIRCFEQAPAPYSRNRARLQIDRLDRMQVVRSFDSRRN